MQQVVINTAMFWYSISLFSTLSFCSYMFPAKNVSQNYDGYSTRPNRCRSRYNVLEAVSGGHTVVATPHSITSFSELEMAGAKTLGPSVTCPESLLKKDHHRALRNLLVP